MTQRVATVLLYILNSFIYTCLHLICFVNAIVKTILTNLLIGDNNAPVEDIKAVSCFYYTVCFIYVITFCKKFVH